MIKQGADKPAGVKIKKQALAAVYNVYSEWVDGLPLACRKGCAACCTRSVTMTSLEGELVLDFVERAGRGKRLREMLIKAGQGQSKAAITTNQYAAACLNQREVDCDIPGSWDMRPCVFLAENTCSIYAVRPFGCRSFGSLVQCDTEGAAVMTPIHLSVNTVFTQVIEHISSDGGYWSTMTDILLGLAVGRNPAWEAHLLPALPVPGFLLEAGEARVVKGLLQQLRGQFPENPIFGDLIDNFLPI